MHGPKLASQAGSPQMKYFLSMKNPVPTLSSIVPFRSILNLKTNLKNPSLSGVVKLRVPLTTSSFGLYPESIISSNPGHSLYISRIVASTIFAEDTSCCVSISMTFIFILMLEFGA